MQPLHVFAPITKRERDPESGHLIVYGQLTGPGLDLDQQRCDPEWLKTAIPDWFNSGANVREMHSANAVGKGTSLEQIDEYWYLTSRIVDPLCAEKIEADVLTGYSIGIKSPIVTGIGKAAHPKGLIEGGLVVESSVVDRPSLPSAKFVLNKMVGADLVPTAEWADADGITKSTHGLFTGKHSHPHAANGSQGSDDEHSHEHSHDGDGDHGHAHGKDVDPDLTKKDLSTAELNDLPDSAFAYIEPGGKKDSSGKTTPRSKRHFAVHDAAHTRNALSRAPQSPFGPKAMGKIKSAAKKFGIKVDGEKAAEAALLKTILASHDGTSPELVKADGTWTHDPDTLETVRNSLAQLMQQELDELMQGEPELGDLSDLLCCLRSFLYWWANEAQAGEDPSPYSTPGGDEMGSFFTGLGANADVIKAVEADSGVTEEQQKAARSEILKSLGLDSLDGLSEKMDKLATTESVKGLLEERDKTLEERFKQIETKVAPGGPTTRAPADDAAKATEADTWRVEAHRLRRLGTQASDRDIAAAYLEKAAEADAKVVALTASAAV
jgi:hypothetical protein